MTMYASKELRWPNRAPWQTVVGVSFFTGLEPPFASVAADRLRGQECEDCFFRGLRLIGREEMAGTFEQDELRSGNTRRDQFPVAGRDQAIELPVNYQGWSR